MPLEDLPAGVNARRDYNDEGRKLIASLGVNGSLRVSKYNDMDPIWKDKSTGGIIYVGNEVAARGPAAKLLEVGITHVVNCTDDMPNYCEVPETFHPHPTAGQPRVKYLRFNVAHWMSAGITRAERPANDAEQLAFFRSLFEFVDSALASGGSVLVHCLAGAHRAGTTGCLLLMNKHGWGAKDAVAGAKQLRPVINPIGSLPGLLKMYEKMRADVHRAKASKAR